MPLMLGALILVFGALITLSLQRDSGTTPGPDTLRAIETYEDAIRPAVERAGQAVILGIRPDIVEFRAGRLSPAVWATDMKAREAEFAQARSTLSATKVPSSLGRAGEWFDRAFARYLAAVRVLYAAADATGPQRDQLVTRGAQLGDEGDQLFDRGAELVQRARRALHAGPSSFLPDPGHSR